MPIGENDDELWDVYDSQRCRTGRTHRRGDPLPPGEYHLVVHICIFNSRGELLIQNGSRGKKDSRATGIFLPRVAPLPEMTAEGQPSGKSKKNWVWTWIFLRRMSGLLFIFPMVLTIIG